MVCLTSAGALDQIIYLITTEIASSLFLYEVCIYFYFTVSYKFSMARNNVYDCLLTIRVIPF